MKDDLPLKRISNPEGHQVCQIDRVNKTVTIKHKKYRTVIHFLDSGEFDVHHQKLSAKTISK